MSANGQKTPQYPQQVGGRTDTHKSALLFGNFIDFKEISSLMKDQGSEFIEHNLVCRNIGLVCS